MSHTMSHKMSPEQTKSSIEAAAEAVAKVNAMLIAKGKLKPSQLTAPVTNKGRPSGSQSSLIVQEVEINDVPIGCRNMLTRGSTQEEISKLSGASVATRGRYMTSEERMRNRNERSLYLSIQGSAQDCVNMAVARINEIIMTGINKQASKQTRFSPRGQPQPVQPRPGAPRFNTTTPPPLMSVATAPPPPGMTVLQEKLIIGLEHAPANFDVKGKVIGPGGVFLQHIMSETGAKVTLRGRNSGYAEPNTGSEAFEPMNIHIQHVTMAGLNQCKDLATNLIQTVQQEYAQFQQSFVAMPQQPPAVLQQMPNVMQPPPMMPPQGVPPPILTNAPPPMPQQLGPVQGVSVGMPMVSVGMPMVSLGQPQQMAMSGVPPIVQTSSIAGTVPLGSTVSSLPAPGLVMPTALGGSVSHAPGNMVAPGTMIQQQLPPPGVTTLLPVSTGAASYQQIMPSSEPHLVGSQVLVSQPGQMIMSPMPGQHAQVVTTMSGPIVSQAQQFLPQQVQQPGVSGMMAQQIQAPPLGQQPGSLQPQPGTLGMQPQLTLQQSPQQQILPAGQTFQQSAVQQQQLSGGFQLQEQHQQQQQLQLQPQPTMQHPQPQQQLPQEQPGMQLQSQPVVTVQALQQPLPGGPGFVQPGPPGQVIVSWGAPVTSLAQPVSAVAGMSAAPMSAAPPPFSSATSYIMSSATPSTQVTSTSIAPVTVAPSNYVYNVGPREEPKRRFTEVKQDDELPENLLGYEHGPPHLTNLVLQPGMPQHQQQPGTQLPADTAPVPSSSEGPGLQPPAPVPSAPSYVTPPSYSGQMITTPSLATVGQLQDGLRDASGNLLVPAPPSLVPQTNGQQEVCDTSVMPPPPPHGLGHKRPSLGDLPPGGSDAKKRVKGKEEEEFDVPSSLGTQVKEVKKYSYNQYSSTPQLYMSSDSAGQQQFSESFAAGNPEFTDQFGNQHRQNASPGNVDQTVYQSQDAPPPQFPGSVGISQSSQFTPPDGGFTSMNPGQSSFQPPASNQSYSQHTLQGQPSSSPLVQSQYSGLALHPPPPPPLDMDLREERKVQDGGNSRGFNPQYMYGERNTLQPPPPPPPPSKFW